MKRMLTILVLLMLIHTCALAESLREQTGAPETLQMSWQSASVPMLINIDAAVEIPDVVQAYRVAVTRHEFTAEEAARLGAAVMGVDLTGLQYKKIYSGWVDNWSCSAQSSSWRLEGSYTVLKGRRLEDEINIWRPHYDLGGIGLSTPLMKRRQAHENPYTPQAAQALADELAAVIAPERVLSAWGTEALIPGSATNYGSTESQTEFTVFPEAYVFCYTPVIGGIPELCTFQDSYMDEENTWFPFRNDRIYIVVAPDGLDEVLWQAPEDYGEQTPCELLPFEQIMNVARELLPLKQVGVARRFGNEAGLIVDRITLSYCRVRKRDAKDAYELVPVWDFFGATARLVDGELRSEYGGDEMPYESLLTINALDGLVIDRAYGY